MFSTNLKANLRLLSRYSSYIVISGCLLLFAIIRVNSSIFDSTSVVDEANIPLSYTVLTENKESKASLNDQDTTSSENSSENSDVNQEIGTNSNYANNYLSTINRDHIIPYVNLILGIFSPIEYREIYDNDICIISIGVIEVFTMLYDLQLADERIEWYISGTSGSRVLIKKGEFIKNSTFLFYGPICYEPYYNITVVVKNGLGQTNEKTTNVSNFNSYDLRSPSPISYPI